MIDAALPGNQTGPTLAADEGFKFPDQDAFIEQVKLEAQARFGRFVQERVNPGARHRDRESTPLSRSFFREAAEIGLLPYSLPSKFGGLDRSKLAWGVVIEQI